MPHTLFVYGTLRRQCGHPMAKLLADRGRYLGLARTPGRLHDFGRYPGATPPEDANDWVQGDVYEIDDATLEELDRYEEIESPRPSCFERSEVDVTTEQGTRRAEIYWFRGPLPVGAVRIASGDYYDVTKR